MGPYLLTFRRQLNVTALNRREQASIAENAGIAQLVEHNLAKVGVASSSLVSRSKFVAETPRW